MGFTVAPMKLERISIVAPMGYLYLPYPIGFCERAVQSEAWPPLAPKRKRGKPRGCTRTIRLLQGENQTLAMRPYRVAKKEWGLSLKFKG